jgi:hypothetical protein
LPIPLTKIAGGAMIKKGEKSILRFWISNTANVAMLSKASKAF